MRPAALARGLGDAHPRHRRSARPYRGWLLPPPWAQWGTARQDIVAAGHGRALARYRPVPTRTWQHAHHGGIEPAEGRRRRRRDAGGALDGVGGGPPLARFSGLRGTRPRPPGV